METKGRPRKMVEITILFVFSIFAAFPLSTVRETSNRHYLGLCHNALLLCHLWQRGQTNEGCKTLGTNWLNKSICFK